jgi:type II secretory pathway pseudopilin PulG
MIRLPAQQGLSLVELLLALSMTAILMAPLATMLQSATGSAVATRAALDLNSDARFALDRIALRAATASSVSDSSGVIVQPGVAPAPVLTYSIVGTDLVESESAAPPQTMVGALVGVVGSVLAPTSPRTGIIAANATAFKLTAMPTTNQALLKIDLTLTAPGGASISASRTVRVGSPS